MRKRVGELQGMWALLFKIVLALVPVYTATDLAFKGWMAVEHFRLADRVTRVEANACTVQDRVKLLARVGRLEALHEKE